MKKFILLLILSFWTLAAISQDMLVTNDGKSMTIYNLEISDQSIFFQLSNKSDAPLQKMLKKDVLIIKKADGTKLDLDTSQVPIDVISSQSIAQKETGVVYITPEILSDKAKKMNDAWLATYNQKVEYKVLKDNNIGKEANFAIGIFGIKQKSVLSSEDVEILITKGVIQDKDKKKSEVFVPNEHYGAPALQFTIINKSNRTIYLDLGNTFYTSAGKSVCYFTPTSTTTTSSSSKGGSVNLGTIADALGVGGIAGTLANGVNVGGGSTNGTSTTTYAQRIISVSPSGSVTLSPQYMFGKEIKKLCHGMANASYFAEAIMYFSEQDKMLVGDHYIYNETTSPVNMTFMISYSKSEDCRNLRTQTIDFYIKDLFGDKIGLVSTTNPIDQFKHNLIIEIDINHSKKHIQTFPKK